MNLNNKIYSIFVLLALVFWNPVSYSLLYSNAPIYGLKIIWIFYWVIFLAGLLAIFLIQKNLLNGAVQNIILTTAISGLLFSVMVIADRVVSLALKENLETQVKEDGLIFEPNIHVVYNTIEFDFEVRVNNLGFRGEDINIDNDDTYRILCLGDSFTYGWGVNVENSWPNKLETYLRSNGMENVEVLNLGHGGGYTKQYKEDMIKAVPLLKPDLVLIGVLQADDLAQLYEIHFPLDQTIEASSQSDIKVYNISELLREYFEYSFVNFLDILRTENSQNLDGVIVATQPWKAQAKSIREDFNRLDWLRFYELDEILQDAFNKGELNPYMVNYYLNYPERTLLINDPERKSTKFAIQEMNRDFEEMKAIADEYGVDIVFINLPINVYTGHVVVRTILDNEVLGPYLESHNNIDPVYHSIADKNDLPYIELTEHFIKLDDKTAYFYKYDGHPNERGYEEIAFYIGDWLIKHNFFDFEIK